LFEVETDDVCADKKANDFSDYPRDHPNHNIENKKVVGKDECCGRPITEFVGLYPKMYSIFEAGGSNIKKAKGVQRVVVKGIRHELYKHCLDERMEIKHNQIVLRSNAHQMRVYEQNNTSLSPLDTKKWITSDSIRTRLVITSQSTKIKQQWKSLSTAFVRSEDPMRRHLSAGWREFFSKIVGT